MAYSDREVDKFRAQVQTTVNAMRDIDNLLAIIEDQGADDAARAAFFAGAFGVDAQNQDITFNQFAAGLTALRNLRTAWETNRVQIVKLLK